MRVRFSSQGSFKNTEKFLAAMQAQQMFRVLDTYAQQGVRLLAASTPVDSGRTKDSWDYKITVTKTHARIQWMNHNVNRGFNVAIGLQYGHGTGTGGYVEGRDYINPSMRSTFDEIANKVWAEIVNA